jgi:N-acylneuraminate cytidylyltransferase/CMP-N,N'-diacetyllegionaminic acid synthase
MTGRRVSVLADLDIGVPLRLPIDVTNCIERLAATDADVVVTAYEAERNPYFNMVELEAGGLARIVKTPAEPIAARQMAPVVFSLSPAVYAIRRDALWAYEHWSQARVRVHAIPRERAVDIDTESDFRFVEFLSRTLELNLV